MRLPLACAAAAAVAAALPLAIPAHGDPDQPPCCASEFDWAEPYADAMTNHGLADLMSSLGIRSALAMENGCGLVPAIGAVATVEKLSRDYNIPAGTAGKLLVAAADVCPEIAPLLG